MSVADILRTKGGKVVTARPDHTILEAVQLLVGNGIGALLVIDEDQNIQGIITERDILRDSLERHDRMGQTLVGDVMTRDLMICVPEDSLDSVMSVMTARRIRHLPIMSEGKLAGIISIGDVVKAKVRDMEFETRMLKDYIVGRYPA
jgi:CBS domain-containing protein